MWSRLTTSLSLTLTSERGGREKVSCIREKVSFIHDATHAEGTYKTKTLGSRLGSLYY